MAGLSKARSTGGGPASGGKSDVPTSWRVGTIPPPRQCVKEQGHILRRDGFCQFNLRDKASVIYKLLRILT